MNPQQARLGKYYSIVVVAEGAKFARNAWDRHAAGAENSDIGALGGIVCHGGAGKLRSGPATTRHMCTGTHPRGGTPTLSIGLLRAPDSHRATRYVHRGESEKMAAFAGQQYYFIPLAEALASIGRWQEIP